MSSLFRLPKQPESYTITEKKKEKTKTKKTKTKNKNLFYERNLPKFSVLADFFNYSKILLNQPFFDQNLKILAENF